MKKRKFIGLALAAALTIMGVGYAAWTDSVTIQSTVATGDLNVPMYVDSSSQAFLSISQILEASTIEHENVPINIVNIGNSEAKVSVNTLDILKEGNYLWAPQSEGSFKIIFHDAKLNITNLYPGASFTGVNAIKIPVMNAGTIPAKYNCVLGQMEILDKNNVNITNKLVEDNKTMLQLVEEHFKATIIPLTSETTLLAPGATQDFTIEVSLDDEASDIFEEISVQMSIQINSLQFNK